jgi:transposase InsO family protein
VAESYKFFLLHSANFFWPNRTVFIQHQAITRPFEQLHSDFAIINGRDFLIIADQYSGWPDVIPFPNKNTTARRVVDAVREFFIRCPGAPVKFWSDNGPQFNAVEFKDFAIDWGRFMEKRLIRR